MDDKLLAIFAEESEEIIDTLERGLLALESSEDPEQINSVFRAAHTMKGNAGIIGFEAVVSLTHLMEEVLDKMRNGRIEPEPEVVGLLLRAVDALKILLNAHLAGEQPAEPADVLNDLSACLDDRPQSVHSPPPVSEPAQQAEAARFHISMRFIPELFTTGTDPLQLLLELADLGEIERVVCHTENLPSLENIVPDRLYLWWEVWLVTRESYSALANVFIFVDEDNEIAIEDVTGQAEETHISANKPDAEKLDPTAHDPVLTPMPEPAFELQKSDAPTPAPVVPASPTIRVDTDKLDALVNLVGELAIGVARVNQLVDRESDEAELSELAGAVDALDHVSHDLQEQVMRVRMVPVEGTFNRFQRVVHDLALELDKKIRLQMVGSETELDKNVIEQVADPLKHLIRNCADHGLETPEERLAAGKTEEGTILLKAYQQEGQIIIEVTDDGRGINRQSVLNKALERGLAQPGASYTDKELYGFMFQPGFSTAAYVTELSGRGVGLDVVRQNIEALRGSVEVESEPGAGSTFRVKLPLTLAIIDGMLVKVGQETLTLPLLSIVESIHPAPADIKTVEGRGELITVRGEYLSLVRLHEILDLPTEITEPTEGLVVIIESVSKVFGILVDDILGEQQAVIKSMEQNYRKVDGVAGATILGDGAVSLILDIHGLEKIAFG
jgi:two-component system chemotaxis sensor kinase CheA